jgi:hypothetical protein
MAGSVAAAIGFHSNLLGGIALALVMASMSDYFLPVRNTLDESGIAKVGLLHRQRMQWPQVRRVIRDRLGVKLSPLSRPSRLEAYRGIYCWFSHDNENEVMAIITHYTSPEAAGGGDRPPVQLVSRRP